MATVIQKESTSIPYAASVTLADGSQRQVSEAVDTLITLGDRQLQVRFLIMPDATEGLLLGLDFLVKAEAKLTCAGLTCDFSRQSEEHHRTISTAESISTEHDNPVADAGHKTVSEHELEERAKIKLFLEEELQKFREIHGPATIATHRINMKEDRPFKLRYAPRNPAVQSIIDSKINELLALGYIEPSHSPYSSPITLAQKKNGTWRLCIDFRQLNSKVCQ